jgi:hypothetical protein
MALTGLDSPYSSLSTFPGVFCIRLHRRTLTSDTDLRIGVYTCIVWFMAASIGKRLALL